MGWGGAGGMPIKTNKKERKEKGKGKAKEWTLVCQFVINLIS